MKTRLGFVSNSSSSSFIIVSKEPLTRQIMLDALKVPNDSLFTNFAGNVADWFVENSEEVTFDWFNDQYDWEPDEYPEMVQMADLEGWHIYQGDASDNGYGAVEGAICDMSLVFRNDTFGIEKEGSY